MEINELIQRILSKNAKIISPLVGGMMNKSYIVSDNDKKYVLFISTKQANEMVDRKLEKEHQQIIYNLGITSKNVYFDTDNGIKMHEYILGDSLNNTDNFDYTKVANLLKSLHQSKTHSKKDYSPFERLSKYEEEAKQFCDLSDDTFIKAKAILLENKKWLESIKKVLCHNDAQKSNIVKSYEDNYYLIDFEFVGNNDPIYDIATFGNDNVEEGRLLLDYYFNNPTEEEIKRYYLWRIFISLQWYLVALVKHYRGEGKIHNINFKNVSKHFIYNAKIAINNL